MRQANRTTHLRATSGPWAKVLINPTLGRSGNRFVSSSRHITGWHWVNYDGEVGAPHIIFDSTTATEEERKICLAWVMGLPHPKGHFGGEWVGGSGSRYLNGKICSRIFIFVTRVDLSIS